MHACIYISLEDITLCMEALTPVATFCSRHSEGNNEVIKDNLADHKS